MEVLRASSVQSEPVVVTKVFFLLPGEGSFETLLSFTRAVLYEALCLDPASVVQDTRSFITSSIQKV